MKTTSLADARQQLSKYVEEVDATHERVTITKNGRPAAVLISPADLEVMEETLFWAAQGAPNEDGPSVSLDVVRDELAVQADSAGDAEHAARLRRL